MFRTLVERSPFGVYVIDADFRIKYVSDGAQKVFEHVRPLIGHDFAAALRIIWPEAFASEAISIFRHTLESGEPYHAPSTVEQRQDTGAVDAYDWKTERITLPDGSLGVICHFYDLSERQRHEAELLESHRNLQRVLDNNIAFVGILAADGTLLEANTVALAAGGLSRDDVIGTRFWDTYWWNHDPAVVARLKQAFAQAMTGESVRYDEVVRMKDDTRMEIDFMIAPIRDDKDVVQRLVVSGYDITDRKQAAEHIQILMREVHHRSKNILGLVQAIARQSARNNPEDFLDRFEKRIQALAAAQDMIVSGGRDGTGLDSLVRSQLGHFNELIGRRIVLRGPDFAVTADAAQALAMAFHELATNASKYGALSNDSGAVHLSWSLGDGRLSMEWAERGGPRVNAPNRRGFGTAVIDTMVRAVLGGTVEVDFAAEGLTWRLECPDTCLPGKAPSSQS